MFARTLFSPSTLVKTPIVRSPSGSAALTQLTASELLKSSGRQFGCRRDQSPHDRPERTCSTDNEEDQAFSRDVAFDHLLYENGLAPLGAIGNGSRQIDKRQVGQVWPGDLYYDNTEGEAGG